MQKTKINNIFYILLPENSFIRELCREFMHLHNSALLIHVEKVSCFQPCQ